MMITRLTTEQFHRALQNSSAVSVNGWPAMVEWAKTIPRRSSQKPYAVLRWTEWDDQDEATPMICELRKDNIKAIELRSKEAVLVTFNSGESPLVLGFFIFEEVEFLAPPVPYCLGYTEETRIDSPIGEIGSQWIEEIEQGLN